MRYGEFSPIYDGDEHFTNGGMPVNKLVSDFWRWNCSDLMNNSMRGSLAEFIVATALEIDTEHPRIDWDAYDLLYRGGEQAPRNKMLRLPTILAPKGRIPHCFQHFSCASVGR